jgi:hypothetical protein
MNCVPFAVFSSSATFAVIVIGPSPKNIPVPTVFVSPAGMSMVPLIVLLIIPSMPPVYVTGGAGTHFDNFFLSTAYENRILFPRIISRWITWNPFRRDTISTINFIMCIIPRLSWIHIFPDYIIL